MGNQKNDILNKLQEEFDHWEALLRRLSEEQITTPNLSANLSIKDVIAHLWAWQQLSIARLEAAQENRTPDFRLWPAQWDSEADIEPINAWIYATYREKPWANVYADWRAGFLYFLTLGRQFSEADLLDPDRYEWLHKWPLLAVLEGSYRHHHEEHLEPLLQQLGSNE